MRIFIAVLFCFLVGCQGSPPPQRIQNEQVAPYNRHKSNGNLLVIVREDDANLNNKAYMAVWVDEARKFNVIAQNHTNLEVHLPESPAMGILPQGLRKCAVMTCLEVINGDCYKVKNLFDSGFKPRTILDIGAHIGTFTVLCRNYFPESRIISVTNHTKEFEILCQNASEAVFATVLGFFGDETHRFIYFGNSEEVRLRAGLPVSPELAPGISVKRFFEEHQIQNVDVLKIDTEECEVNLFQEMDSLDLLKSIYYITGEWHYEQSKVSLTQTLSKTHNCAFVDCNWNVLSQGKKGTLNDRRWSNFHAFLKPELYLRTYGTPRPESPIN